MGNLFVESGGLKDESAGTKTETTAVGASYKMGAVNLYALRNSVKTTATDHQTMVGVEYSNSIPIRKVRKGPLTAGLFIDQRIDSQISVDRIDYWFC